MQHKCVVNCSNTLMSYCQNPLHVSSCYCYGYRFGRGPIAFRANQLNVYIHKYIYIYKSIYICIHIYIYTYIHVVSKRIPRWELIEEIEESISFELMKIPSNRIPPVKWPFCFSWFSKIFHDQVVLIFPCFIEPTALMRPGTSCNCAHGLIRSFCKSESGRLTPENP